jgi:hypothetical protein
VNGMEKKIYFGISIFIALALPIIIGLIYFNDLYKNSKEQTNLAALIVKPNIIYTTTDTINELDDVAIEDETYESGNCYEFEVSFEDAISLSSEYSLYLTDIKLSSQIDRENFKWKLFMQDYKQDEYVQIGSGNFDADSDKIQISKTLKIGLNTFQKFKFYYYLAADNTKNIDYVGSTVEAKIILE